MAFENQEQYHIDGLSYQRNSRSVVLGTGGGDYGAAIEYIETLAVLEL